MSELTNVKMIALTDVGTGKVNISLLTTNNRLFLYTGSTNTIQFKGVSDTGGWREIEMPVERDGSPIIQQPIGV